MIRKWNDLTVDMEKVLVVWIEYRWNSFLLEEDAKWDFHS